MPRKDLLDFWRKSELIKDERIINAFKKINKENLNKATEALRLAMPRIPGRYSIEIKKN